jgi:hypothetical protein
LEPRAINKLTMLLLSMVFLSGCATYQRRIDLTPEKSASWKKTGPRQSQMGCKEGEVEVFPIVKQVLGEGYSPFFIPIPFGGKERVAKSNAEGPGILIKLRNTTRLQSCDLSFISLENPISKHRIQPIKAETTKINDDYSPTHTTYCNYYFDSKDLLNSTYNLYISKEIFGCELNPILYKQENVFEYSPMQMM